MAKFTLVFLLMFSAGCAHKKQCHNCVYGPNTLAIFKKSDCKDIPGGDSECNHVVFHAKDQIDARKR